MNLVIDYGNTNVKLYFFLGNKIVKKYVMPTERVAEINSQIAELNDVENIIISKVRKDTFFEDFFRSKKPIILTEQTPIPIHNLYKTPHTLGKDRLAAVVGANFLFPNEHNLVIDAGTAITYDIITNKKEYLGGNISPGILMRFKALNFFTDALPLLQPKENFSFIGNSTDTAIINGVMNGVIFEIEKYIEKFVSRFSPSNVIITGGDSFILEKRIKKHIFAEPNLVAIGLNRILNFNLRQ